MKVFLISHTQDPEAVVAAAINQCYSASGGAELKEKISPDKRERLINIVMNGGHLSTIEHASFTFAVEGVSRALTHQLVRHRVASFSQQSQRYVKFKDGKFDFVTPPKIAAHKDLKEKFETKMQELGEFYEEMLEAKVPAEDARAILPNATATKIVFTMNARSLLNFFEHRLCVRAQAEIREMATKMLELVEPVAPNIFKFAGPTCATQKICWEGDLSCGKWKAIEGGELRSRNPKS
ncbi:MAG: FAD-dependent thymidylate synthase [Candidatus Peribacteraceae bacterium]|nr:FAD-dependent thymidylate synthase [Candidatus Peribacteraceae bacterium]